MLLLIPVFAYFPAEIYYDSPPSLSSSNLELSSSLSCKARLFFLNIPASSSTESSSESKWFMFIAISLLFRRGLGKVLDGEVC